MTNEALNPNDKSGSRSVYDLEERTALFGETVIRFGKTIPKNSVTMPLVGQAK